MDAQQNKLQQYPKITLIGGTVSTEKLQRGFLISCEKLCGTSVFPLKLNCCSAATALLLTCLLAATESKTDFHVVFNESGSRPT